MSVPVSAVPSAETKRRSANYQPSIWGDYFLSYHANDDHLKKSEDGGMEQQVEMLKKEVKRMLVASVNNKPSEKLDLVDTIQRLGISYHFETEIDEALRQMYNNYQECENEGDNDCGLYFIALWFRLLRQQGYNISCDVFNNFKDIKGNFKESLTRDVKGMLSLYEATHMMMHGEDILDEALAFTTTNLEAMAFHLSHPIAEQVKHALKQPIRKGLPRLEARHFMSVYEQDPSHDKVLLAFAKLDFNLLQKVHQKELMDISRWDISAMDKLPEYMKLCYQALLDVYTEVEEKIGDERLYRLYYAKEAMKNQVRAYFQEAKWFHQQHTPTVDEYMSVALVTCAYKMLATTSFVGMGDVVTKHAFDWLLSDPKMVTASKFICRLMDDIVSHKFEQKRGHVVSAVECYMKEHDVTEEETVKEF